MPMSLDFDPFRPWVGVMQYAARCQEYWDRTVIRPAQTFLARGGASSASGRQMTQKEAEESQVSDAASAAMHRAPGEGTSKTAKRRQRDKAKIERLQEDNRRQKYGNPPWLQSTGKGGSGSASGGDGDGHPRRAGREFQTDREGNQICFTFAKGPVGSCSEPCPQQRTHCCQFCLGSHPNAQCQQKGGGKGKGKKGNKK